MFSWNIVNTQNISPRKIQDKHNKNCPKLCSSVNGRYFKSQTIPRVTDLCQSSNKLCLLDWNHPKARHIVRYFKQIWTNCSDLNYFRCSVTFVNVQLMRGLVIIRQLLIFDNVLFVRIILSFASPLSTLKPPLLIIRIINSQRNNASKWFWSKNVARCLWFLKDARGSERYIASSIAMRWNKMLAY